MKRLLSALTLAAAVATAGLAGCQSQQITPDQLKQAINNTATLAAAGCTIVQPTLAAGAVATANPAAGVATAVNGVFCASQSALATATAPVAASTATPASAPAAASTPLTSAPLK